MKPPLYLTVQEIDYARKLLVLGWSLTEAADALGIEPARLDLALWNRLIRHGKRVIGGRAA